MVPLFFSVFFNLIKLYGLEFYKSSFFTVTSETYRLNRNVQTPKTKGREADIVRTGDGTNQTQVISFEKKE